MFFTVGAAISVPSLCRIMEGLPVVSTTAQLHCLCVFDISYVFFAILVIFATSIC